MGLGEDRHRIAALSRRMSGVRVVPRRIPRTDAWAMSRVDGRGREAAFMPAVIGGREPRTPVPEMIVRRLRMTGMRAGTSADRAASGVAAGFVAARAARQRGVVHCV
ncbi:MAG: hypothetical protein HY927_08905 [Elusimicrobia bacterium]|nr:hypothetical protein [Elusimicrobiota bacterium]